MHALLQRRQLAEVSNESSVGHREGMKTLFCFHGKTSPAALLVSQDSETAATLVSQINPVGVKLFSYLKPTFVFVPINVHATCWPLERKRSIHRFSPLPEVAWKRGLRAIWRES